MPFRHVTERHRARPKGSPLWTRCALRKPSYSGFLADGVRPLPAGSPHRSAHTDRSHHQIRAILAATAIIMAGLLPTLSPVKDYPCTSTPASSSPVTVAWSAAPSSGACRPRGTTTCCWPGATRWTCATASRSTRSSPHTNPSTCSWPRPRSAASSPTTPTRPSSCCDNLQIQNNVIDAAYRHGASKLFFLGSSCIYPKLAPQPIKEEYLLTGPLEPTNEWYAIAKIAGIKLCQAYRRQYGFDAISLMPTNLYGPGDNFDLHNSHVLPALIRKFHEAKLSGDQQVVMWGTGTPRREFLHVDDLADACVLLMQDLRRARSIVNVGVGEDITIRELAEMVKEIVGYQGEIVIDTSKPDGTPRKLLDVSRLHALGWQAQIGLREGITETYRWFLQHAGEVRA